MVQTAVPPSIGTRGFALTATVALLGATLAMLAMPAQAAIPDSPTACGPIIEDDTGRYCVTQGGLLKTFSSRTGEFLGYIHGGDPRPVDIDPFAGNGGSGNAEADTRGAPSLTGATYPNDRAPHCVGPTSPHPEYYTQVVYVRYASQPDTYAANVDTIRDIVRQANGLLHDTAKDLGKPLLYKVRCVEGEIDVYEGVLGSACSQPDCFNDIVTQLRGASHNLNDPKVKYWVWTEDTRCGCGGKGHVFPDDSLSIGNQNNGNAGSSMFAVTFHGDTGVRVMMHEHGHNMGAVQDYKQGQNGANNQGHCWDGSDIMCYTEPGEAKTYSDSICPGSNHWDCNSDTYFHPKPPAGSYLADHWNLASHLNRYLVAGNAMPDTVPDAYKIDEDSPEVALNVLANDKDEENDPLYLHQVDAPLSGAKVSIKDNRVAYTPPADYYGIDVFNYTVRDRQQADNESVMFAVGTITVDVRPVNDAPEASGNSITTPEDTPVSFVLDAFDVEGDPMVWTLSKPLRGEVLGTPPDITYEPNPDVAGLDEFTFTVTDPFGLSSSAVIEIDILPRPDAPNANDDTLFAIDGVPQWPLDVLANDDAGPGDEPALETFSIQSYGPGAQSLFGAALVVDDRGTPDTTDDTILYTPPSTWPAGFAGTDSFEYTIVDNGKIGSKPAPMTDTATVTVHVQPDDLAAFPDFYSASEDTVLEVPVDEGVLWKASPAIPASTGKDPADHWPSKPSMAGVSAVVSTAPSGTLDLRADGSFTYKAPPDFAGMDEFTYYISAPEGDSNVARVEITVDAVNDPPVAKPLQIALLEDTSHPVVMSATDVEDDAQSPPLPVGLAVTTQPEHGRLETVGTPPTLTYFPALDYHGPDAFAYTATDSDGATSTAAVTVLVEPVNDAPLAVADDYLARPDRVNMFPTGRGPLVNDHEPDGDVMRVEIVQPPRHGKVALASDGGFSYTPPGGFLGQDHFLYRAVDPDGAISLPATVTVRVAHNVPPTAFFEFTEAAFELGRGILVREGSEDPDGTIVSYHWDFGDGNTSTLRVPTHTYGAPGVYTVTLTVRDDDAEEATWSQRIHIAGTFGRALGGDLDEPRPVADAGDDHTALPGEHIRLDGTRSHAEDGELRAFEWTQIGGPQVLLHDATGSRPFFTAPAPAPGVLRAVLTFELVVFDSNQESWPDTVQVEVFPTDAAHTLEVEAGEPQVTLSGAVVRARATATDTGTPTIFTWTQTSGPPVSMVLGGASMQFQAPHVTRETLFTFEVIARADGLASTPDELRVVVSPATPPKGFTTGGEGPERSFTAIVPAETPLLGFAWDFGDGTTATGNATTHAYAAPGAYTVRLTATTHSGYTESWEQDVVVPAKEEAEVMEVSPPSTSGTTWLAIGGVAFLVVAALGGASLWLARRADPLAEAQEEA